MSKGPIGSGRGVCESRGDCRGMSPKAVFILFIVPWALAVVSLLIYLTAYSLRPGPNGPALASWPKDAKVSRPAGASSLIMFVHPQCPCTRASVAELDRLVSAFPSRINATVVFLRPSDRPEDWVKSDLWESVLRIPGAQPREDVDGRESTRFGVKTSGETVLFDPDGNEIFRGGLTSSRGHEGASDGTNALRRYFNGEGMPIRTASTYGCALFSPTMDSRAQ